MSAERLRRRPERNHHAEEPDQDRAPAPPADALAQEYCRQRGDEHRAGEPIGDDVGERQPGDGKKERRDLQRRQCHAQKLKPGPLHADKLRAVLPDQRRQD
jgi:hypothetical protein